MSAGSPCHWCITLKPLKVCFFSPALFVNLTKNGAGYAPSGFCEADASSLPRFVGDVLNVAVGEVRTDEHSIAIKLQQPDNEVKFEVLFSFEK